MSSTHPKRRKGFTLAELLIALAILGVIATFVIPKIISSSQGAQSNAIAKEDMAMVAGAFQQFASSGSLVASSNFDNLTPYMNYVSTDTATNIDTLSSYSGSDNCGTYVPGGKCLVLHNGSRLLYKPSLTFSGTTNNNAIWFHIDPDGQALNTATTTGQSKTLSVFIYFNGRMADEGNIATGTISSDTTRNPNSIYTPVWFTGW